MEPITVVVSFRPGSTCEKAAVHAAYAKPGKPLAAPRKVSEKQIAVAHLTRLQARGLLLYLQDQVEAADRKYAEQLKQAGRDVVSDIRVEIMGA